MQSLKKASILCACMVTLVSVPVSVQAESQVSCKEGKSSHKVQIAKYAAGSAIVVGTAYLLHHFVGKKYYGTGVEDRVAHATHTLMNSSVGKKVTHASSTATAWFDSKTENARSKCAEFFRNLASKVRGTKVRLEQFAESKTEASSKQFFDGCTSYNANNVTNTNLNSTNFARD